MIELHWTEVDGVAVVWAEAPGALRAGLFFRTGRADETLATSGHTHLIEHMAFTSMLDTLHRHNGMVDGSVTGFYTVGRPGEVCDFLGNVCHALTSLPAERLEEEKRLLEAESATRPHDFCGHLLVWRYGAAGHGLTGMPEFGRNSATIDQLREFSAQRFTRGNAILWLTGPPPAELRLPLPPGGKLPPPKLAPIQETFPCWFLDNHSGGVAAGAVVPRACASMVFADIALERLRKRLRNELALSYGPAVYYFPLDADVAHFVLYADADEARRADLASAFGAVVAGLEQFDDAEVEGARARIRDHWSGALAPSLEDRVLGELQRAALDWLFGKPYEPRQALESELEAATKDDVAAVGRQTHASVMFALPGAAQLEPWCGTPAPASTAPVVAQGREAASMDAPVRPERLRYGPEGVSLVAPDGSHFTVRYAQLALALHHDDGCVALIGDDAATLTIEPTLWRDGHEVCRRIREHVPGHLLVARPPRHESEIPRPGTTAWQRFFAHLGLDEDPGGPVARLAPPTQCPNCGAAVIQGSVHCIKCGHLLDFSALDPARPMQQMFKWCLMGYGFWRLSSALRNGTAALHSVPGSETHLFVAVLSVFSVLSLVAMGMLFLGMRKALILFVVAELAIFFWVLMSGDSLGAGVSLIAISIVSVVGRSARFQVA